MFETAVIGPFAAGRLRIVQQCIECRRAAGVNAPPCNGFGPGCIYAPRGVARAKRRDSIREAALNDR